MPIYEYKCSNCGHRLEKLQKMSDEPLKECPECNEASLSKLVSASSFKLKGTGWYETDFKNKTKKNSSDTAETTKTTTKKETSSKAK